MGADTVHVQTGCIVVISDLWPPYEYADAVNVYIQGTVVTVGADTVNIQPDVVTLDVWPCYAMRMLLC